MEKLNQIIESMVAEKSLSLEVFQQLKEVKEQSDLIAKENTALREASIVTQNTISKLQDDIIKLNHRNAEWAKREEELVTREKAILDSEHQLALKDKDVEKAQAVSNNIKEIVGIVFKNPTLRTGIMKSTSEPVGVDQYGNTKWASSENNYTEVKTEE